MKKEFIYTMLKNYGKYTKDDMNRLVSDTDKITIQNLTSKPPKPFDLEINYCKI